MIEIFRPSQELTEIDSISPVVIRWDELGLAVKNPEFERQFADSLFEINSG
jgi:hypothetical protein